ncbi:sulfur carrier protein ThiS [Pseudodesulfovibrio piezophilus]|uniref:Thiamine biosynthesis protein ThiS n=1 Tax=Pseudodesulfovibrio piezophilus (strain DSM 21447 / JCM 15486 / C1TLV30) TaxID=1322246 RepID=M1WV08_PSEP2|nr:sulfur carrier protein ThiS [Pseudodesulfovibrio piezophilus]CCH48068.1 Thiamine biosynthesis protein ThiS [Pseudodesulfovibrio piezophilus C1TLV30]
MDIVMNGKNVEVAGSASLLDLLELNGIDSDTVVIELNGQIIPSVEFDSVELNNGDHLEVLRFVGGG